MSASSVSTPVARSQRMSFVQQRLWFVEQLQAPAGVANPAVALRVFGALEAERLAVHLGQTIARQEVFRTRYVLNANDAPEAQVLAQAHFLLRQEDFSQQRKQLERRLQQEQQARFDLTHPPLLRGLLLRLGENEHVLLLVAHPIVIDQPSLVRFANDWMVAFAQTLEGHAAPAITSPAGGYGDFAAWQQQEWHNGVWAGALHEVCDTLRGVPELLKLPWDHARPTVQAHAAQSLSLPVPAALLANLAAAGERHDLRLDAMLFGLYALLLGRLSSQTDFCLGVPVDTRAAASLESLPGHFENLLPVRVQLGFDKPVHQLLLEIQQQFDFMLARKALPYEKVLETLALPRSSLYSPLVQASFSSQPLALQSPVCSSLRFERFPLSPDASPFDLLLHVGGGDKPVFTWQYNTALLEGRTLEQWHRYFLTLISSAIAGMDVIAGKIALLDEAQQQALLQQLSGDNAQLAEKQSLYSRIVLLSRQVPRHTAIIQGEQFVRFQSLVQQAESWAASLRNLGVMGGERVVMPMPRSAESLVALLAVWRAGGCAVPVPPQLSEERARAVLLQLQPALTLFHAGAPVSEDMIRWRAAAQGVCEFATLAGLPAASSLREEAPPRLDAPALLLMSGDDVALEKHPVDKPAGHDPRQAPAFAQVSHGALLNLFQSLALRLQLRANVQWLAMAEFYQDIGLVESLMPLLSGAGLVIASPAELEDVDSWAAIVKQRTITCMIGSPARFRALLEKHTLPAGSTLFSRNELLSQEDLQAWLHAGATVVNLTGTPETGIVNAMHLINDPRAGGLEEGAPVGKPLLNTRLRVVDEQWMQVLPGGIGELLVGGGPVSPGYWQRDDLNNERFVHANGERYFRTGYRARLASNGQVCLLERPLQRAFDSRGSVPAAALENAVLRCWQHLLGRDDIGLEQSFTELGGTSLAALRLAAHVNRYFGASLPLAVLLQTPTVRAQAWCLQNAGVPLTALSLQTLQPGQPDYLPWVFLYDECGSIAMWQSQIENIPAEVPVYALQCHRYSEADSLTALAEECAALLPESPLLLAGSGFGGALAVAIALKRPQQIHRLTLIDTPLRWEAASIEAPAPVESAASADASVADEHCEQLALHHQQLWKRADYEELGVPLQVWLPSEGLVSAGAPSGWELLAHTLDVTRCEGTREQVISQWSGVAEWRMARLLAGAEVAGSDGVVVAASTGQSTASLNGAVPVSSTAPEQAAEEVPCATEITIKPANILSNEAATGEPA